MIKRSPALTRILEAHCCAGCGICAAVSGGNIEMQMSPQGFLRPKQHTNIADETDRLIADICPGMTLRQNSSESLSHLLWGPVVKVRTGASTEANLRYHASSGGALSALLLFLLDSKTVDFVVQTATSEVSPIENAVVESRTHDDIYQAAGSRYGPSAPLKDLLLQLKRPGRFALVAKPCDIAAVRALARRDFRIAEKIPILLSFFCAGIPSLRGTRKILSELDVPEKDLKAFTYRGNGWPGQVVAKTTNGRNARMSYSDSWGGILSKHLQFRCKICPDGSGGFADIVCGDAWYCGADGYPLFEEADGRSLVISRTDLGERIVRQAVAANFLTTQSIDIGEIRRMQPSQSLRKRLVLSRLMAMALLGRPVPHFVGLGLLRAAISAGLWLNLKSFLGTVRRLLMPNRYVSGIF
jgi:coenzyme F420 hydrogenase subunit beta